MLAASSLLLCSCHFFAPSIETENDILVEAGYNTRLVSDSEIMDADENSPLFYITGVSNCLYANKGSDEIYLIYFLSIGEAETNYNYIYTKLEKGQINELVYCGTKQAVKDAKL